MKPLANLDIAEFCNQMHLMLSSGISGIEALHLLLEDVQDDSEKELLELYDEYEPIFDNIVSTLKFEK